MRTPRATITVDDPRALGRHTALGFSRDFPWVPPEGGFAQLWQFEGCEYIPSQQAVGPRGGATRVDMDIADWTVAAGSWTDRARLAMTPRTLWLWAYNTLETAPAGIQSNDDYPAGICVWVQAQAANESSTVTEKYLNIVLTGAGGTEPAWGIFIPTGPGPYKFPLLMYYDAGVYTATPTIVSEYDEWAGGGGIQSTARDYIVWIEPTAHQWIIGLAVNGQWGARPWVYQPPGMSPADALTDPLAVPGPVQLQTSGQAALFAVAPIVYPEESTARTRAYYDVTSILGAAATAYTRGVVYMPLGTDVDFDIDLDGTAVRPVVTMETTGDHTIRPVVGATTVAIPAVIGDVVSAPWSSASRANSLLDVIEYTRRCSWRGNELRGRVLDSEGLDWTGNNVVQLTAAWHETGGAEPSQEVLFTGYLQAPRHETATEREYPEVEIEALDWAASRGLSQFCANMAQLGGYEFASAFVELGMRAGFAAANIDVDGSHGGYTLPIGSVIGERMFWWRDDEPITTALDALCASIGWRWGIRPNGDLFTEPYPAYGGTPDYTIDLSGGYLDEDEFIESLSVYRDMSKFANVVHCALGPHYFYRGNGVGYSFESVSDPASEWFVGSVMAAVEQRDQYGSDTVAATLAGIIRDRRLRTVRTIELTCARREELAPDAFVEVIGVDGVTDGAIYYVTEERGRIIMDELDWFQEITMVEVEVDTS